MDLRTKPSWYRIIRTERTDGGLPDQVVEFVTASRWTVAQAVKEIWERTPNVKQGKEYVRIIVHQHP